MNKKLFAFTAILFLILGSLQTIALTKDSVVVSEIIEVQPPLFIEHENTIEVSSPSNTGYIAEEGYPALPVIRRTFILPYQSEISSIDVSFSQYKEYTLSKPLKIVKNSLENAQSRSQQFTTYQCDTNTLEVYPSAPYEYTVRAGLKDGEQVLYCTILCYPFQYHAEQKTLISYQTLEININYTPPKQTNTLPDDIDLLIIAPQEFSGSLDPLVNHKNDIGIPTLLKTTEEIYQEYSGVDKPEQIKYCIKDLHETLGVSYVLLVGGLNSLIQAQRRDDRNQGSVDWHVPIRYTNVITTYDPGFLCDLYYADLYDASGNFSSWDTNQDGIFGSYKQFDQNKDIIDLMPDIAVGRLPCRNINEVDICVQKIITYESTPLDSSWFYNFVLIGGDTFDDVSSTNYLEGELETQKAAEYLSDFTTTTVYSSNREHGGLVPNTDDIVSAISEGCGFLFFAGHGSPEIWNTHWAGGPFERDERTEGIWWKDMVKLTNEDKLPIAVVGGCHNSQFNITALSFLNYWINEIAELTGIKALERWPGNLFTPTPECFSWVLTNRQNGGSIATLGNTGTGIGRIGNIRDLDGDGVDDPDCIEAYGGYLEILFFKSYGQGSSTILGDCWQSAITEYLTVYPGMKDQTDCKTVSQWVLLGDPSLCIGGYE